MKNRESGLPFDDFRSLIKQLPSIDDNALQLTKVQVSDRLGEGATKIGDMCEWFSAWSGRSPVLTRPIVTLFAGTHAVDQTADSWLLDELEALASGASPLNRICHQNDAGLKVLDLALQIPVADISVEPALDEKSCAGTIAFGMEAIAGGTDLLCVAAIENSLNVSCLAILSALWGLDPDALVGENQTHQAKLALVASELNKGRGLDGFEILRRLGGREMAAICGAILAARSQHVPVLIAGPTAICCASVLEFIAPGSIEHCRLAQATGNAALDALVQRIGLKQVYSDVIAKDPAIQLALCVGLMRSACLALSSD